MDAEKTCEETIKKLNEINYLRKEFVRELSLVHGDYGYFLIISQSHYLKIVKGVKKKGILDYRDEITYFKIPINPEIITETPDIESVYVDRFLFNFNIKEVLKDL